MRKIFNARFFSMGDSASGDEKKNNCTILFILLILVVVVLACSYGTYAWYNNSYVINSSRFDIAKPHQVTGAPVVNPATNQVH